MDLQTARYLTSQEGGELLHRAAAFLDDSQPPHAALTRLRASATPELAAAAWEVALLRRQAAGKFGADASALFFDRDALEMASAARVAAYHAARFVRAGAHTVLDLGGGIGADSLAIARAGLVVTLFERDEARATFAAANAHALGLSSRIRVVCADVTTAVMPEADAAFLDPARRAGAQWAPRRWTSPEETEPPLSLAREIASRVAGVGIKLSPAVPRETAGQWGDIEFVSDHGECKEAFLALGSLCERPERGAVSAVVLSGEAGSPREDRLLGHPDLAPPIGAARAAFLYEPDPAVIRAHLVGALAERLGAWQFDSRIAYLLADRQQPTPFATAFRVDESLPYSRKAVQAALRRRGVGRVVVKKRGLAQEPEDVRRMLRLSGENEAVLILARAGDRPWAFIAQRLSRPG